MRSPLEPPLLPPSYLEQPQFTFPTGRSLLCVSFPPLPPSSTHSLSLLLPPLLFFLSVFPVRAGPSVSSLFLDRLRFSPDRLGLPLRVSRSLTKRCCPTDAPPRVRRLFDLVLSLRSNSCRHTFLRNSSLFLAIFLPFCRRPTPPLEFHSGRLFLSRPGRLFLQPCPLIILIFPLFLCL